MKGSLLLAAMGASLAVASPCRQRESETGARPTDLPYAGGKGTSGGSSGGASSAGALNVPTSAQSSATFAAGSEAETPVFTPVASSTGAASNVAAASSVVASASSAVASSAAASVESTSAKSSGGFTFAGCSESGAEFGNTVIPGTEGTNYAFPDTSTIDTLIAAGMNTFRVSFLMERLAQSEITATFNTAYFDGLNSVVTHVTGKGAYVVLDPHNYGRYNGNIITNVDDFGTFWKNLATKFKSNKLVIFDTNNEYHDMDNSLVKQLNQAAITAIRDAGATSQYIFVEGNAYTGAHSWVSSGTGASLVDLTDPEDKIVYEMHQYLDSDSSGTLETCVSSTIGTERLSAATAWLKANNKKGVLGETAGGNNDVCKSAIKGELEYLSENSDVWMGFLWWAAGPMWGDYMFSMEPSSGVAYENYLSILKPYFP